MTSDNMMSDTRQYQAASAQGPDRETLSALFDGELQGDAARFAMRRLGHDAQWRDACGRWQLLGDVLRGQASAQAPAGFAGRVEAALAAERDEHAAATGTVGGAAAGAASRRWSRGRIGGAALAASVAFAALLVIRPGLDERATVQPSETLATAPATTAAPASATVASVPQIPQPDEIDPSAPAQPAAGAGLAAAAVAVAELPRRARNPNTRSQSQRAGSRIARAETAQAPLQIASAAPIGGTAATALASSPTDAPHPFLPQADEIPSRPWPRATLPEYSGNGAFTVSFQGTRAAGSPSFYPFEPRMPQPDETGAFEVEPEGPRR